MKAFAAARLQPAGHDGAYFQLFGPGYRNILGIIPGSDPALGNQFVLISAHYDHVGYGTRRNSNGPIGYIHNGADDNASGTAAVLELIEAFQRLAIPTRRSVLFVLWDGEEKGLLGSLHWLSNPTVALENVRLMINLDMVGRLRQDRLSVAGTRTMPGLRESVSRANLDTNLEIDFPWDVLDNSDHHAFYRYRIPALLLHTGLHEDYHRPSDDADKVNSTGMERVTAFAFRLASDLADRDTLPAFRRAAETESAFAKQRFEQPLPPSPPRLGITWGEHTPDSDGLLIRTVVPGSAADRSGIRAGDRIVALDGEPLADAARLHFRVLTADQPIELSIVRGETPIIFPVPLDGGPTRLGISWRVNDAEPGVVTLSRVATQSPAYRAGLRSRDRIYEIAGTRFADSREFAQLAKTQPLPFELVFERNGRLRHIRIDDMLAK
jgi:hypothetical protein